MSVHHGTLIGLGILLLSVGVVVASTFVGSIPLIVFGISLCLGALALLVTGVRMAMSNVQVTVPGHYLLHPRTGTRFNPQQALAIQRRLDQMRREMSADSVTRRPEPEPSLPSTPPPWTMEPPPSYDMVMNSQNGEQL
ncbi:uncharacterized protein si:dkeyp-51f12.3 [Kryptolebias marmoratus]|uniref:uncharacterized protein si:dkeyp-51f12.3 n=1 Tax=Kryptolebias marmoratus TaxID=37003 RepID=UPI0018ACA38C|nr:uncharacterized protein si:dkeyp-51f12.3 [Kryptolebias marmoratus]XP_037830263.1 uncharacterized protein si:dkeyp-51f12.3 [Kryptolebias marmoratus]